MTRDGLTDVGEELQSYIAMEFLDGLALNHRKPDELVENAAESGDKEEDEVPDQEPATSIGRSHCDPRGIRENTSVERMMERGKLGWTACRCLRVLRGFWFTAKLAKEVRKGRQERERSIASYFCSAVMSASHCTRNSHLH